MNTAFDQELASTPEQLSANVSKLFRHLGNFDWSHVTVTEYKPDDGSFQGVSRRVFVGERGESPLFHTRYFELAEGGYTTLEQHLHEHVVVVMRGQGVALVGDRRVRLGFGDVLYVAPDDVHQLSNSGSEPFGFLCIVNAQRDRPRPVNPDWASACDL
jgi:quercetin dioxygenase-like cupin family protein